jgi:Family of unknown function (DUF6312)/Family of unknown function (DUF6200)
MINQRPAKERRIVMATAVEPQQEKGTIVVDLKRQSRKQIRRLRRNMDGKLAGAIQETLDSLKSSGRLADNAQPVVFVVRQKKTSSRLPFSW